MEILEYYKVIRNTMQLVDVRLASVECHNYGLKDGQQPPIKLAMKRGAEVIGEKEVQISLKVILEFKEDAPFYLSVLYKGLCISSEALEEDILRQYAHDQVVPLLLPYARECITSHLSKMGLPLYYLPTIDVLETVKANLNDQG